MNHYLKTLIFALVVVFAGFQGYAQHSAKTIQQFDKALQYYKIQEYDNAISEIEKLLKKSPDFVDATLLLADVYHDSGKTQSELETLEGALKYARNALIYLRLGKGYLSLGNYEKALVNFETYLNIQGISETRKTEVEHEVANCRFAIDAIKNPVEFTARRLSENINSENDEYWPSVSLDGARLVFTRLQKPASGLPHEDFFISEMDSSGWGKATPIKEINTHENEGAQALSSDGRLLFFTACNRPDGNGSCDIYYSVYNGKFWSKPKNAGIILNSRSWDAQPTLSSDNRYLYFSSNREGGKGKKDIWRAELLEIKENGNLRWSVPVNAGSNINTPGDEISPFFHPDNKSFYFASDYHTGMGGLDLFMAKTYDGKLFTEPKNLGFPINTFKNEQGLNISSDGSTAFFASERLTGFGLDIYTFQLPGEIRPEPVTYIKAKITDAETGESIRAVVELIEISTDSVKHRLVWADENGGILLCLPLNNNYGFNVSHEGYLFYSQSVQLKEKNTLEAPELFEIKLNRINVGAEMNLYNIYFETDSFRILPASEPELEKLTLFMKNNSQIEIEIQGHTDNTGSSEKNMVLSENRAKSVAEYIISNGIPANRIKYKGLGETVPVATNETIEGRMLNRRTAIIIAKK